MATFHASGAGELRVSTVEGHDRVIITVERDLALHIPTPELPSFIDNLRDALTVLEARAAAELVRNEDEIRAAADVREGLQ